MDRARHPSEESRDAVEARRRCGIRDGGRKERIGRVARCIYRAVWLGYMTTRKCSKHKDESAAGKDAAPTTVSRIRIT